MIALMEQQICPICDADNTGRHFTICPGACRRARNAENQAAFRARTRIEPSPPPKPIPAGQRGVFKVQLGGHRGTNEIQGYALIDAIDVEFVSRYRWSLINGYATRGGHVEGVGHRMIRLHREILNLEHGDEREVDHVNRDRLDCRRRNIRIGSHKLNTQNVPPYGSTGYRGVRLTSTGRYQAHATIDGKFHHLGVYETAAEAGAVASYFRRANMPGAID